MTPQMSAGMGARRILLCGLMQMTMPDYTLRLCDGSGVVAWGDTVFVGRDPRFGVIGEVEELSEAVGDAVPGLEIVLLPPSTSAAVELSAQGMQGGSVRLWLALVDTLTGHVVPDPELLFAGEIDVSTLELKAGERRLNISIVSAWERLFEPNEGALLSDSFHRSIWPEERGFAHTLGATIDRLWGPGEKPPAATVVADFPRTGVQQYF